MVQSSQALSPISIDFTLKAGTYAELILSRRLFVAGLLFIYDLLIHGRKKHTQHCYYCSRRSR